MPLIRKEGEGFPSQENQKLMAIHRVAQILAIDPRANHPWNVIAAERSTLNLGHWLSQDPLFRERRDYLRRVYGPDLKEVNLDLENRVLSLYLSLAANSLSIDKVAPWIAPNTPEGRIFSKSGLDKESTDRFLDHLYPTLTAAKVASNLGGIVVKTVMRGNYPKSILEDIREQQIVSTEKLGGMVGRVVDKPFSEKKLETSWFLIKLLFPMAVLGLGRMSKYLRASQVLGPEGSVCQLMKALEQPGEGKKDPVALRVYKEILRLNPSFKESARALEEYLTQGGEPPVLFQKSLQEALNSIQAPFEEHLINLALFPATREERAFLEASFPGNLKIKLIKAIGDETRSILEKAPEGQRDKIFLGLAFLTSLVNSLHSPEYSQNKGLEEHFMPIRETAKQELADTLGLAFGLNWEGKSIKPIESEESSSKDTESLLKFATTCLKIIQKHLSVEEKRKIVDWITRKRESAERRKATTGIWHAPEPLVTEALVSLGESEEEEAEGLTWGPVDEIVATFEALADFKRPLTPQKIGMIGGASQKEGGYAQANTTRSLEENENEALEKNNWLNALDAFFLTLKKASPKLKRAVFEEIFNSYQRIVIHKAVVEESIRALAEDLAHVGQQILEKSPREPIMVAVEVEPIRNGEEGEESCTLAEGIDFIIHQYLSNRYGTRAVISFVAESASAVAGKTEPEPELDEEEGLYEKNAEDPEAEDSEVIDITVE